MIVMSVVAVIAGRAKDRGEINRRNAQILQIVELLGYSPKIAAFIAF